ncbi:hypothetical protein [Parabacteroides sp. FAFU027]|uniref:hypothetical protein n=1 Tax=Parabacteroides sp. FAFU027 TaxID=2922715 RepID=UPI001FAE83C8|nr:hypothetical protein [Parabacteroides sp. FAFU027]
MDEIPILNQKDFEMAQYITHILFTQPYVIFSWGYNSPVVVNNGMYFKVNGFKHQGYIEIKYIERYDLFDLKFFNFRNRITHSVSMVYVDQLISIIDDYVERVDNYEQAVKDEYNKLCPITDN